MDTPRDPERVRRMFDRVARRYDGLNHLLSLNLDRRWRRLASAELAGPSYREVLDLCGGTGDLAVRLAGDDPSRSVVCGDFSEGMLARAERKFRERGIDDRCRIQVADALDLPFPDGSFDAATVAFGVRNLVDRERGFRELARVLRPGGRLVVLEFSRPTAPILRQTYRLYLNRLLPRIGDRISGNDGPYGYLARTIGEFPGPAELAARIRANGFTSCRYRTLTGGIVALHTADRGGGPDGEVVD